jgi:hypothetical protein
VPDPVEEWHRLSALYSEMSDVELVELRDAFDDLTDVAQDVLRDELKKRQLWEVKSSAEPSADEQVQDAGPSSSEHLRLGVTVGTYDTTNEAKLAGYVLELAGIEAVVADASGSFDLPIPVVRVAPEDAERAAALLAQPISPETRAEFEATINLPDFEVPQCPQCKSEDVLLEAVEPNNQWVCDDCGHSWEDATPS